MIKNIVYFLIFQTIAWGVFFNSDIIVKNQDQSIDTNLAVLMSHEFHTSSTVKDSVIHSNLFGNLFLNIDYLN
ncbi:hypothetical protein HNQ88_002108 [Aureibacter tunicatorum]|uniref:Uncharacterized protein n=1 Tax=Aureibacter tunicatorum TaxID=866807 RepID=A0AAE3XNM5_9BACT|nr:hypothetical protein [Aureibacter tunicatorum]BDD05003.1 hypothetical protein AUTU_24860 [Aureibacter tunicatorum]